MRPRATYRLQCHKEFGFEAIGNLAEYLALLGISHIYTSPWLKARPGSRHGYDIVDHQSLNPELGDEAAFAQMLDALNEHGLGRILDFVPNHMGVGGSDNPLWLDVLEWGRDSRHAGWFDIEWQPDRFSLRDKLLIPLLAQQYGAELHDGKLTLRFDAEEGSFAVWAYETHKLPVCPLQYQRILGDADCDLERFGDSFAGIQEWRPQIARRAQDLKGELALAAKERTKVRQAIDEAVSRFNGTSGDATSWENMQSLIQDQHWRVAHFRVAGDDINFRRFFDINELAGLRMELPSVFEHAHALVLKMLKDGTLDGLRIDHIDGLLDPKGYLRQLRTAGGDSFYLIVEKILAPHESLRDDWPVDGTTGYEFANLALGLLTDPSGEAALTDCYAEFAGERRAFSEILRECKLRIMRNEMASELNMLAREAARVAYQQPVTADFTWNVLRRGIRQIVACFPVYRTYVDSEGEPSAADRRDIHWAMKQARAIDTELDPSVFDFLEALITGELVAAKRSGFSRHAVLRFAMKLQQYSGPVMAKGMEDTAFYRYNRLVALNEVGGHPDLFGISLVNFHKLAGQRARYWPHSMAATSTHDTKRGEDSRARLAVLSEMPEKWAKQVRLWSHMLRARRGDLQSEAPPDANDEYLFYQLLLGSWPAEMTSCGMPAAEELHDYSERLAQAMLKSIREAKVHSTWAAPNLDYENAALAFVKAALDPVEGKAFLAEFLPFQEYVARLGMENSLAQTVLKLTMPGVPDIYQGSELWDLSLMDPDNRRPVDYGLRLGMLRDLTARKNRLKELVNHWPDGRIKLFVTHRILQLRAEDPELFAGSEYEPLMTAGSNSDCLCAFARLQGSRAVVVLAARFPFRREQDPDWRDTTLAIPAQLSRCVFRNLFTGDRLTVRDIESAIGLVFDGLPVAVLTNELPDCLGVDSL